MAYAGAEGETERQMADVLHFELPEGRLHAAYGTLAAVLNAGTKDYRLSTANRLWGQNTYPFHDEYLATTRDQYRAELARIDFAQTEQARQTINAWVEKQTAGKIADLIPPGVLEPITRLVLTNAVYFKGNWADEFPKGATEEADFHVTSDKTTRVPLMHQTDEFGYAESDGLQVLAMPYAGRDLSMVVLLPTDADGLADLEKRLTAENLASWTSGLGERKVRVFLPRFKMTSEFSLKETLQALGMTLPFSETEADFSGISSAEELMISAVVHKAYVEVNEQGTEAAAASAVLIAPRSAPFERPEQPPVFRADHPFVFLIRDNRTGAILFLGRVVNPRA